MKAALCVTLVSFVLSVGNTSGKSNSPRHKVALLVGINHYKSNDIPSLDGCLNDVADLKQLLTTKYGFKSEDVHTLKDSQASHSAIIDAFKRQLIDPADGNTSVVFYFSGHGSTMKDTTGTEPDGLDETIVPYDSRQGDVFDISDKQIAALLSKLLVKTHEVTLIFDSCHSGTMTRALGKKRQIDMDPRTPPASFELKGFKGKQELLATPDAQHLVFSACRAFQVAQELERNNTPRGAFTYYFVKSLRNAKSDITFRDVIEEVKSSMAGDISAQDPTTEGNLDRIPFGAPVENATPYFLVHHDGGKAALTGGVVEGITSRSRYKLFPPKTKDFKPENAIATVEIGEVTPFTAEIKIDDPSLNIPELARAVEVEHAFGEMKVGVSLQLKNDKLRRDISEQLKNVPGIAMVSPDKNSRLIVTLDESGDNILLLDAGSEIELDRISVNIPTAASEVRNKLNWWISWISKLNLTNSVASLNAEFTVRKDTGGQSREVVTRDQVFKDQDQVTLLALNKSNTRMYFTILDYSTGGAIQQVYPPLGSDEQLAPGVPWHHTFPVFCPTGKKQVRDIVRLVLTRQPVDFRPILRKADEETRDLGQSPEKSLPQDSWATFQRVIDVVSK